MMAARQREQAQVSRLSPQAKRELERTKRRVALTQIRTGDAGTPELARHHRLADDITNVDGIEAPVKRVVDQRPIDRYLARQQITEVQWRAGDKIGSLAFRAGLMPRITTRYSDMPRNPGGGDDCITARDAARHDYLSAMSVLGKSSGLSAVIVAVCVTEQSAANWAAGNGIYRGQKAAVEGMTTLRLALDRLVEYWRMR